jgi:hypothetical protein
MAMFARQYEPMLAMACVDAGDDMLIRGQVANVLNAHGAMQTSLAV